MVIQIPKRDPKERASVYNQFDAIQHLIHQQAPPRDIQQALDVLSRLTRIRRIP